MTSYSGFIAVADIPTLKAEFPVNTYLAVVVGPLYPMEALKFYDFQPTSTDTPDDDEWVKPDFAHFDTVGRWRKVDVAEHPQMNADWAAVSGPTMILNKPALATVATSGLYNDLGGKPSLATVATSGSYVDLSNKPSIPSQYTYSVGAPTSRSLSLGTAYQAIDNTKPSEITITLTSTAALTLGGGSTFEADLIIGSTSAVASGTGTVVGKYKNSLTGTLVVGLAINNAQTTMHKLSLPAGWYFAIRQITGTGISVVSAYDQAIG